MNLETILRDLHTRQNDPVLPITLHVLIGPTRIALLDSLGDRHEFEVSGNSLTAYPTLGHSGEQGETIAPPATEGVPPPQRINVSGFEVTRYHGGPA